MRGTSDTPEKQLLDDERRELLARIEDWLETPMIVLGFVWLALFIVEEVWRKTRVISALSTTIYVIFIVDYLLKLILAPRKWDYIKSNWLTLIALVVPALRVFRIFRVVRLFRAVRVARGMRLVRIVSSLNRGMRALGRTMSRRGFGYVLALTFAVTLVGAAGMLTFENNAGGRGLNSYGAALWWTAMLMTTMGSEYWPQTAEGRVLCLILSLYAFAVFGYVTATLATFFIGRDAESEETELAGAKSLEALRAEVAALRAEIKLLSNQSGSP